MATGIGFVLGRCTRGPVNYEISSPSTVGITEDSGVRAEVIDVIDGDSLTVRLDSGITTREKVRLLGVDAPERAQPGHSEASAALRELIKSGPVFLFPASNAEFTRDRYGRLLAFIRAADQDVNIEMVRAGRAMYARNFGGGGWHQEFVAAEEEARSNREGIWADR